MKVSLSVVILLATNILLIAVGISSYRLIDDRLYNALIESDLETRRNKLDLIAYSVRDDIATGDSLKLQNILMAAMSDRSFKQININAENIGSPLCMNIDGSCVFDDKDNSTRISAPVYFDEAKEYLLAEVTADFDTAAVLRLHRSIQIFLIVLVAVILLVINVLTLAGTSWLRREFRIGVDHLEKIAQGDEIQFEETIFKEKSLLIEAQRRLSKIIHDYKENLVRVTEAAALSEIAQKVAHDIRSPIAALRMVLHSLRNIPLEEREVLSSSANRISDIAEGLLDDSRRRRYLTKVSTTSPLKPILRGVIEEKRIEYRARGEVELSLQMDPNAEQAVVVCEASELKSILSNLINNSFEAIDGKGWIRLILSRAQAQIQIEVLDSGKGIPEELLTQLGSKELSAGKERGAGIAIYNARRAVQSWGGSLEIHSKVGQGTSVRIKFETSNNFSPL